MINFIYSGLYASLVFNIEHRIKKAYYSMKDGYPAWLGQNAPNEFTKTIDIMSFDEALEKLSIECFKEFCGDVSWFADTISQSNKIVSTRSDVRLDKLRESVSFFIFNYLKTKYDKEEGER